MRKALSHFDLLLEAFAPAGKTAVDVGCGEGGLVRWLAQRGAFAAGIDTPAMLAKVGLPEGGRAGAYIAATAQRLPFRAEAADAIFYVASFHHVPAQEMAAALQECGRVLKPGGVAVFVEPVAQKGAYTEVVRLIEDEAAIQAEAYEAIRSLSRRGFRPKAESIYYLERSLSDFAHLAEVFIDDGKRRAEVLAEAGLITGRLAREAGTEPASFRYRSVCRLNAFEKLA